LEHKRVDDGFFEELQLAPTSHNGDFKVLAAAFNNFKEGGHRQLQK
jgi:hypothetical protein